jgi:flagellar motor switch protein FliN/FliY
MMMETISANGVSAMATDEVEPYDIFGDIPVKLRVEVGQTTMRMEDVRKLCIDSIITLDTRVGENIKIYVENVLLAWGEIVQKDGNYGVRILTIYNNSK